MHIGSQYINDFDYKVLFNLASLNVTTDLSPSSFTVPASIDTIAMDLKYPNGQVISRTAWTGGSALSTPFSVDLLLVNGIVMWGYYKIGLTVTMKGDHGGDVYKLDKKINICAPGDLNSNIAFGELRLISLYQKELVKLTGLSNYRYKQKSASVEERNVTLYYPPESEAPALKNISYLPLEVFAFVGNYIAKGILDATYDFEDLLSVKVRYTAHTTKNVRGGATKDLLYGYLNNFYEHNFEKEFFPATMLRIMPLLEIIRLGIDEGYDVDDKIFLLEKMLGVECQNKGSNAYSVNTECHSSQAAKCVFWTADPVAEYGITVGMTLPQVIHQLTLKIDTKTSSGTVTPPPPPPPPTTDLFYVGWSPTDPYVDNQTAPIFIPRGTGNILNGVINAPFNTMPSQYYPILKLPASAPVLTSWYDTPFNNGQIPDSVWRPPFLIEGTDRYYIGRNPTDFDTTPNHTILIS